ncbi:Palmitoyltransferase ZDHHC7 [Liparis tanakae]|uniref:Palmitoyltransferase ZDHHC7 n=1 Tax=Liparis tanakae TaxID=230148 RepID=A0A4Z2ILA9_9TELE|nr:Palmitoyltransferase ZDHHC7 [Liparis tanakae]
MASEDGSACTQRLPAVALVSPLRASLSSLLQGIERLKGETGRWAKVPRWEAVRAAFGGPPSAAWCSPFAGLSCRGGPPPEHEAVPQGPIVEEDVIEIPL